MNKYISKYFFYMPATVLKGELVSAYLPGYRDRQYISEEQLSYWQAEKAIRLLNHAFSTTDYYRDVIKQPINSVEGFWELFKAIDFTEKSQVISKASEMRSTSFSLSSYKTTGGSTGEPVKIKKNANALARERAATWRGYEWAGVGIGDPQGRFWGVPHLSLESRKSRIVDLIANRTRVSAFELSEKKLFQYFQRLSRFRPRYLYGYVSVIEIFAKFIEENNLSIWPDLKSIITTSEVLTNEKRKTISEAFKVRVFNEYGCGEVGSIAHECKHGSMHVMSDNIIVETVNGEATGELVVTDLFNYAQPLIRYRLGDFGTLSKKKCSCGITLPVIDAIHGRAYDLVRLSDGRTIHPEAVMYIFEELQSSHNIFHQFQVIQNTFTDFLVFVVPTNKWEESHKLLIRRMLQQKLKSNIQVEFKVVSKIDRESSGKMRVIKSRI